MSDTLGLLHFHETGIYRQFERAKQGVVGYGFIDPVEQTQRCHMYIPNTGGHHCRYYLSFLIRSYFITRWKLVITNGSLPSGKDMEWVHEHREEKDIGKRIEEYLNERKQNPPPAAVDEDGINENKLIFGYWPRVPSQYVVTQVQEYLRKVDAAE